MEGLSSLFHRLYSLGHDPILGFVAGVFDIMNGTITTIDKNGRFLVQKTDFNSGEVEQNVIKAIIKEFKP